MVLRGRHILHVREVVSIAFACAARVARAARVVCVARVARVSRASRLKVCVGATVVLYQMFFSCVSECVLGAQVSAANERLLGAQVRRRPPWKGKCSKVSHFTNPCRTCSRFCFFRGITNRQSEQLLHPGFRSSNLLCTSDRLEGCKTSLSILRS